MARRQSTGVSSTGSNLGPTGWPAWLVAAMLGLGLAALAGWQGTLTRQSPDAHWSVGAVITATAVTAWVAGVGRQRNRTRAWAATALRTVAGWRRRPVLEVAGVTGWALLAAATIGWDLNSFAHQSHDLPTLSHFVGFVTAVPAGRGLLFAAWLALGGYLAVGWRRGR